MLDGLVLQIILTAIVIIAAVLTITWFMGGINGKRAVWIVGLGVPLALIAAVVFTMLSA